MGVTRLAVHGESIGGVAAASVARHCQASGKSEEGRKEGRGVRRLLYIVRYMLHIVYCMLHIVYCMLHIVYWRGERDHRALSNRS